MALRFESSCATKPITISNKETQELLDDLIAELAKRGVRRQDLEDEAHATFLLMLEQARKENCDLLTLCQADGNWNLFIERERSRYRRLRRKLPRQLVEELHQAEPADPPMSEDDAATLIRRVTEMAMLSPQEKMLIGLYTKGITDNAELARLMAVSAWRIANIKNKALSKLRKLPGIVSMLM